ncbi:hypothetical protein SAMN04488105_111121 [Salipiger thiooxidans]|uniref:Tyr recombinase domain-containing protein n=1 Tax=Salipiger thiooxidans TaxID=282683 RepID=A0A1G7HSK9_9RHOB|nr:hypothetical protein [Salipiger thiooxidans]SDF03009.1 hypothetical protein SAMN04488105_111121 [Salipiger thiooxidans]
MTRKTIEEHLAPAPTAIRRLLLEDRHDLEPGAAAVVGRLFASVHKHRVSISMPPAQCFREAAQSESTFRTLLRALSRHAPHVCTAEAVEVSDEWYARRRPPPKTAESPLREEGQQWPDRWREHLNALQKAKIKESSRQRYIASVDRCVEAVSEGRATADFGFITAMDLEDAFLNHPDADRRIKTVTAPNYLDGLIALGRAGGENRDSLDAMRCVSKDLRDRADLECKNKEVRIAKLMERGGFSYVVDRAGDAIEKNRLLPSHSAAGRRKLQAAVLSLVLMNKPPRKGDVVRWRFGHELVRDPDGVWRATWMQEKTGHETESGRLWPEVCALLDRWILGGRPDRLVVHRYLELTGHNWLSLSAETPYRDLPSELTKSLIGVPSHDLRTLAADYLRRHDPARAAQIIRTHLGHATDRAGDAYATECIGTSAQRLWQSARGMIADTDGNAREAAKIAKKKKKPAIPKPRGVTGRIGRPVRLPGRSRRRTG